MSTEQNPTITPPLPPDTESKVNAETTPTVVDLWTDVVCPWCYIGEGRLEAAIEAEGLADRVQLRVHSFELDPNAPIEQAPDNIAYMESVRGMDGAQMRQMETQIQAMAAEIGREYAVTRPMANTRRIHRVMKAVEQAAGEQAAKEFFFDLQRGYFTGERNPFEDEQIVAVAERNGLNTKVSHEILNTTHDEFDGTVEADVQRAIALGARGVPFMVFNQKYAAPGALPLETYRQVLTQLASPAEAAAERNKDGNSDG